MAGRSALFHDLEEDQAGRYPGLETGGAGTAPYTRGAEYGALMCGRSTYINHIVRMSV